MKRILLPIAILFLLRPGMFAQSTAWDFNMNDCNGNMHHLFSELDSGNVVIMEFFMLSCSPCIDAGDALEPMFNNLRSTCSNKIRFYHFGYTNSYTCTQITNWVSTNGYTSVPFDSGSVQTAYYGGMGMPTVAIAAGPGHKVLYSSVGFLPGDTGVVADSIRTFFGCSASAVHTQTEAAASVSVYPNPSSDGVFKIESPKFKIGPVKAFDAWGRLITQTAFNPAQGTLSLDVPNGFYFLKGEINGGTFFRKIAVIR